MNPALLTFDYAGYIANPQFVIYSDPTYYPESLLQLYWNAALNYASPVGDFGDIQGDQRQYMIQLLMSHIIYLTNLANTGNGAGTGTGGSAGTVPYLMQTATIDKVNVGLTPPPLPNQFQWWLSTTVFGQMLLAMLQANSIGGHYVGGSAVRSGFGFGYAGGGNLWGL